MGRKNVATRFLQAVGLSVAAAAAVGAVGYNNSKRSRSVTTESDLTQFGTSNPDEILDWLRYGILADYVYHSSHSPTNIPEGLVALTTGVSRKPLCLHDEKTGFYAEGFAKLACDEQGLPRVDRYGNALPRSVVIVWRGTPLLHPRQSYQHCEGYPRLSETMVSDFVHSFSRIPEIITQKGRVDKITELTRRLEEQVRAVLPEDTLPVVYAGLSQGATNAIIAAEVSQYKNVSAVAFNGLPHGGLLVSEGFYESPRAPKIISIHAGGDWLTNGKLTRFPLAAFNGLHGMMTFNNRHFQYGNYPFFIGEEYTLPEVRPNFLFAAHMPAGLVHSLGVFCLQTNQGRKAAEIVAASYSQVDQRSVQIKAFLQEADENVLVPLRHLEPIPKRQRPFVFGAPQSL
jgi:hypothetical protein